MRSSLQELPACDTWSRVLRTYLVRTGCVGLMTVCTRIWRFLCATNSPPMSYSKHWLVGFNVLACLGVDIVRLTLWVLWPLTTSSLRGWKGWRGFILHRVRGFILLRVRGFILLSQQVRSWRLSSCDCTATTPRTSTNHVERGSARKKSLKTQSTASKTWVLQSSSITTSWSEHPLFHTSVGQIRQIR